MISKSYAVSYPRTVMVKTECASITHATVMSSGWSMLVAFFAECDFGFVIVFLKVRFVEELLLRF
jgi:hypothetical protein